MLVKFKISSPHAYAEKEKNHSNYLDICGCGRVTFYGDIADLSAFLLVPLQINSVTISR